MRWRGLEPPRPRWPLGPQPSASTNSATTAREREQCSRALIDRRELALERFPFRLEPRRQRQALPERRARLVDEEPRPVRRDLDQDAVRHPEVHRVEVLTVLHRRRAQPHLCEPLEPRLLLRVVLRAPRDVVGRPCADQRGLLDRLRELEGCVLDEQAGIEIGIADHRDVAQPRRFARIEPQPQAVRILDLSLLVDEGRLEPDRLERAATEPAGIRARPFEERDQRSGASDLVAEVEVVAVRVVEVDRLLDKQEADPYAIEW